jgi:hypothetical protein
MADEKPKGRKRGPALIFDPRMPPEEMKKAMDAIRDAERKRLAGREAPPADEEESDG